MTYEEFLESKITTSRSVGFEARNLNPKLFPFQSAITSWALQRGRAAIFADCGLGKSLMELEWLHQINQRYGGSVLLLTPLGVAKQMTREAAKFGYEIQLCRTGADVRPGINVTNYERLHHYRPSDFQAIVLDESSILKAFEGSTRKEITAFAKQIDYRLAASATPAPNDQIELTNHSDFLDVMTGKEVIAQFFTQDGNTTQKYRLKKHAVEHYYRWLASWSVAIRKPSDLGYSDEGYVLPELRLHHVQVESPRQSGLLFSVDAVTLEDRRKARRASLPYRAEHAARLVSESPSEPWVLWVDLNDEADELKRMIPEAVEIRGSEDADTKEDKLEAFARGQIRVLVTKPSIAGHGLNWQHCCKTCFVGISDSFENYYQAIRRFLRFGQKNAVDCYIIASEAEGTVVDNVRRKEAEASEMFDRIVEHMIGLSLGRQKRDRMDYLPDLPMSLPTWLEYVA